ncbi:MAG: integration host factor subunit alpha [Proteobacteria bacterium]|nr:integration host factor subunit alpha [Pseudomonadota bacterium]
MTLTKAILITELTNKLGLSKPEAQTIVEAFFEEMSKALVSGDDIKLANFGVFAVRQKAERRGRNPKTGEDKVITARRVVSFHPSGKLRVVADVAEKDEATKSQSPLNLHIG